jgi:hypothetical protein
MSGGAFSAAIPARSLVTYVIKPTTGNTIIIKNPGNQTGTVGTPVNVPISVTDSSSTASLAISITGLPAGLEWNTSTSAITGTPTTVGTSSVTINASDSTGASASAVFNWTINPGPPPAVTVTNPGSQSSLAGTAASLQVAASDSNGLTLTYSAAGLPPGLSINSATGLISGAPTTAGTYSVTVTVTDNTGASGSAPFTWTVTGAGGACKVVYTNNSQWPGGFTAQVVITNTGTSAISSWSLVFTFPGDQKVTQNYNGGFSQSGETTTLTNASYNGSIAPGGSVTDGFQGTWTNSNATPTAFTLNGATCTT